jgi:hypothetical protein
MKFICLIAIIIAFTAIVSCRRQASDHMSSTTLEDTDKGRIYYLDKHNLVCNGSGNKGSAMSFFRLNREGTNYKVKYDYSCINSEAITGTISNHATNFDEYAYWNRKSVQYLDRHNVMCDTGKVLRGWKINRNQSFDKIQYTYTCVTAQYLCCKTQTTSANDYGDKEIFYLDRHGVGFKSSTQYALKGFKLYSNQDNKQMWYSYEMCKLKDMDAAKAVSMAEINLKAEKDSLQIATLELEALQAKVEAMKKRVVDLDVKLSTARDHKGLKASC